MTRRRPRALLMTAGIVASLALAASVAPVTAAFTDFGQLNTQYAGSFDIGGVDADGIVHLPDDSANLEAEFGPINGLVPGNTVSTRFNVFNNSVTSTAAVTIQIAAEGEMEQLLRYSAVIEQDGTATVLFGDPNSPENGVAATAIPADIDTGLAPRGTSPLSDGDEFDGPANSIATIRILTHLLDDPSNVDTNSTTASLSVLVVGASS